MVIVSANAVSGQTVMLTKKRALKIRLGKQGHRHHKVTHDTDGQPRRPSSAWICPKLSPHTEHLST